MKREGEEEGRRERGRDIPIIHICIHTDVLHICMHLYIARERERTKEHKKNTCRTDGC